MRKALLLLALAIAGCVGSPPKRAVQPVLDEPLQAVGTEPFWSVEARDGQLRFSTPDDIEGTTFPGRRTILQGAVNYTGRVGGERFAMRIAPGECSDGMSDEEFHFTARVTRGTLVLNGCARPDRR